MAHRITPRLFPSNDLAMQSAQENVFNNQEILFNIFQMIVTASEMSRVSLVSRLWCQVSSNSHLWSAICYQTGIPVPLDVRQSRNAYCCQAGSLFLSKVRGCTTPLIQEMDIKLDFSNCHVHFVEDAYLIVQHESEISICSLKNGEVTKKIAPGQKILFACTSQKEIYLSLDDRTIQAYSLTDEKQTPFLTIQAHTDEDIKSDPFPFNMIQLLANDRWLISRSSKMIKQWDRMSGECVSSAEATGVSHLQIDQNKLYVTIYKRNPGHLLAVVDLNQCLLNFENGKCVPDLNVHVNGNSYSYIENEDGYLSLSDSEESSEVDFSLKIRTLNFHSMQASTTVVSHGGFHRPNNLIAFNGLAILARDGYDPNEIYDDSMTITDPDVIELIDLQANAPLHCIQKHHIHGNHNQWSIAIFQDTILYATEQNQVVKITFPQTEDKVRMKRPNNFDPPFNKDNKRFKSEGLDFDSTL
ncbi:MAG: F-box protein [Verrucomicrobia bacterium]|nr:F-box protein [Verrucomicrobiota bacterium]